MKAVIQRVSSAKVTVDGKLVSKIGNGLTILLGVKKGDTKEQAQTLAEKCANLRVFADHNGKFNLSLKDVHGEALVISQFTLLADVSRGRRPSFTDAEEPTQAKRLYEFFISSLSSLGIVTRGGIFGEYMLVSLENKGPVTVIMEE